MQGKFLTQNVKAPNFKLYSKDGYINTLDQYKGQWVFLFFYPKDETPGCITEVCAIRDNFHKFKKEGIIVIGVSADDAISHEAFSKKYNLSFLLLCDYQGKVSQEYGAWGEHRFDGKVIYGVQRESFLINPVGIVVKHYKNVDPAIHAEEVLEDFLSIKSQSIS